MSFFNHKDEREKLTTVAIGEVTIRCLLPQGLSLFGPVNSVQPSTRIFRSIGVQATGICDAFSQFPGSSLSAGRFQNTTIRGQNEIDGPAGSVPYLLRSAASWTPPASVSTSSSESVTPPQSRLQSLDTPHPSDDTQSVDSIQSTHVIPPLNENIAVSESVSARFPPIPPVRPLQHTPARVDRVRTVHGTQGDSPTSVRGISSASETTDTSPSRITPNDARSPSNAPSSSPVHSPNSTVMDVSQSPQPAFKKEFRAFRNCREGRTAWYFSYGPYSLPVPPESIRCEPGDLYLHLDQSSDNVQSWVMQTDHAWIIAKERMPHPKLSNRVLWFRTKEEPSWVTIHTLRTYDSKMRHDQLKRQLVCSSAQHRVLTLTEKPSRHLMISLPEGGFEDAMPNRE